MSDKQIVTNSSQWLAVHLFKWDSPLWEALHCCMNALAADLVDWDRRAMGIRNCSREIDFHFAPDNWEKLDEVRKCGKINRNVSSGKKKNTRTNRLVYWFSVWMAYPRAMRLAAKILCKLAAELWSLLLPIASCRQSLALDRWFQLGRVALRNGRIDLLAGCSVHPMWARFEWLAASPRLHRRTPGQPKKRKNQKKTSTEKRSFSSGYPRRSLLQNDTVRYGNSFLLQAIQQQAIGLECRLGNFTSSVW